MWSKFLLQFFFKWANPGLFFVYFRSFSKKHQYNFYKKSMWKNVHPVYGARIRSHNLSNLSRHPQPLDQGSSPKSYRLTIGLKLFKKKSKHPFYALALHRISTWRTSSSQWSGKCTINKRLWVQISIEAWPTKVVNKKTSGTVVLVQLAERSLPTPVVRGSNPVISKKNLFRVHC